MGFIVFLSLLKYVYFMLCVYEFNEKVVFEYKLLFIMSIIGIYNGKYEIIFVLGGF